MLTAGREMRVLVGVTRFSIRPTFKAHAKPKNVFLFSLPRSGTENRKSSALIIRLRASVAALSWVGTASVEYLIFDQRFILDSMSARPLWLALNRSPLKIFLLTVFGLLLTVI